MIESWQWKIEGTAADAQSYTCSGTTTADIADGELLEAALRGAFHQLTQGRAVFGKPGVGCRGPYKITRVVLELGTKQ